ncbi:MAG: hypothetical protein VR69_02730 [Peptococcaceae bacterium BRH_c4b]|nr:MAG: hypothetical protein VR69_02730 [Peptococcaceae bacterium BRH_c4b]
MNFKYMAMLTSKKILEYTFKDLEIYTYTETQINSNMYVVFSGKNGIIIDPIVNDEVTDIIFEYKVKVLKILLTHEHYDHISGVNYYKKQLPCVVICSAFCAEALPYPRKNLSRYYNLVMQAHIGEASIAGNGCATSFSCKADVIYKNEYEFTFGRHRINAVSIGGHSAGSSIILIDNMAVFSGDNLIPEKNTVVTLPSGSLKQYELSVKPIVLSLNDSCHIFPGHGIPETLKHILSNHPDYFCN